MGEGDSQDNRATDLARDGRNCRRGLPGQHQGSAVRPSAASPVLSRGYRHALRSDSRTSRSRSSRTMALDMADWTMRASRAATVKLAALQHAGK
jgi:hypothetical protein